MLRRGGSKGFEMIENIFETVTIIIGGLIALLVTIIVFVGCSSVIWVPSLLIYLLAK